MPGSLIRRPDGIGASGLQFAHEPADLVIRLAGNLGGVQRLDFTKRPRHDALQRYGLDRDLDHSWVDHIRMMKGVVRAVQKHAAGESLWDGNKLSLGIGDGRDWRVVPTDPTRVPSKTETSASKRRKKAMQGTYIANRLSAILQMVVMPRVDWSPSARQFRLALQPQSLIGCLWLQAATALSERKEFRRCIGPGCAHFIEISLQRPSGRRTDAEFCSDACRARDYRRRRAQAREWARKGLAPTTIAEKLRSDAATVRGWLKR